MPTLPLTSRKLPGADLQPNFLRLKSLFVSASWFGMNAMGAVD